MRSGQRRWSWRLALLAPLLSAAVGCATDQKSLDKALLANRDPAAHCRDSLSHYVLHSPDVLEIVIRGQPQWSGTRPIEPDGRIWLDELAALRVDGLTPTEVAQLLARLAAVPAGDVSVRVAEYNSQQLFLLSDVPGLQHVVPYQGPETVVDLLQRVGGISSHCAPGEIQVVRAHVADGKPPEVIHVDLAAILLKHDYNTNIPLQSFDQIYLGQSRESIVWNLCSPWMKPLYHKLSGIAQRERASQNTKDQLPAE